MIQEYILAKTIIGLLYKYCPDSIPVFSLDLKNVDFKQTYKYLQHFSKKSLPEEVELELKQINEEMEINNKEE